MNTDHGDLQSRPPANSAPATDTPLGTGASPASFLSLGAIIVSSPQPEQSKAKRLGDLADQQTTHAQDEEQMIVAGAIFEKLAEAFAT